MKRILPLAAIGLAFAIGAASPAMAGKYQHERSGYGYNAPAGGGHGHDKGYGHGRYKGNGYGHNKGYGYGQHRQGYGQGYGHSRHRHGHGGYRPAYNYYGGSHSFGTLMFRLYGN